MAKFNIEQIIKSGVEKALNKPIVDGKSITEWAAIGMKAPRWISVKDRLPERKEYLHESNVIRGSSEYVLVYISATFPYKRMFVTIGRYSYDEMYPRWVVRSSHDGDVTHWMPLPEPPKEEI